MILTQLKKRLLLKGTTAQTPTTYKILENHLSTPRVFYLGIDPTAEFLHLGHFMQLIAAKWMMSDGHRGIVLLGEFTASIGDPSGRSNERESISHSVIVQNTNKLESIIKTIDDNTKDIMHINSSFNILRNSWNHMPIIEFFSLGKEFSLSSMLSRDCIKSRLSKGISYTEFSYMLFQANDFLHLNKNHNCTIQLGGSDQLGNMISGINLIHGKESCNHPNFGITMNLLTDEKQQKIGKSLIQAKKRGKAVISDDYNDAVYLYNYLQNIKDCIASEMILKLSDLDECKTKKELADFVIDCCWKKMPQRPSTLIKRLLNLLYYPESSSHSEADQLFESSSLLSSFVVEVDDCKVSNINLLAEKFDLNKNEIKKAIKSGKSIKIFDLVERKWHNLKAKQSVEQSFPKVCVVQYGSNIPLLIKQ